MQMKNTNHSSTLNMFKQIEKNKTNAPGESDLRTGKKDFGKNQNRFDLMSTGLKLPQGSTSKKAKGMSSSKKSGFKRSTTTPNFLSFLDSLTFLESNGKAKF